MTKISTIIMPIYNKFLPECEAQKIALNLDLPDPTISIQDAKTCEKTLKSLIESAIRRIRKNGSITIRAAKTTTGTTQLVIKDSSDSLTREEREAMTTGSISVRSRMGYGTTVTVEL